MSIRENTILTMFIMEIGAKRLLVIYLCESFCNKPCFGLFQFSLACYLIMHTYLHLTVFFPHNKFITSQFLFFFRAFIFSQLTFFHSKLVRASYMFLGTSTFEILVKTSEKVRNSLSYDTNIDIKCCEDDLTPFFRYIRRFS